MPYFPLHGPNHLPLKFYTIKRLLPNVRIYAYAQKNTDMRIKNTHMRIKFLLSLVCFILPFTEHAFFYP